jgi:hypothetical protein
MIVEVSIGEAIDKHCVLNLKQKKIMNEIKKKEIQKELDNLSSCSFYIETYNYFYQLLMYVNEQIWDLTDIVKTNPDMIKTNPSKYSEISKNIFDYNQNRFRIKNWFNLLTNSNFKEQKSFAGTTLSILVDEKTYLLNLSKIAYLSIKYDTLIIYSTSIIENVLNIPTIYFEKNLISPMEMFDFNFEIDTPLFQ